MSSRLRSRFPINCRAGIHRVTHGITQLVVWLNSIVNPIGRIVFAPIAVLPGWLSATIIGVGTGLLTLLAFKFTSNQQAIKRVRSDIKANLLALALFKDSVPVSLKSQGRIVVAAAQVAGLFHCADCGHVGPDGVATGAIVAVVCGAAIASRRKCGRDDELEQPGYHQVAEGATRCFGRVQTDIGTGENRRRAGDMLERRGQPKWNSPAGLDIDGTKIEKELAIGDGPMRVSLCARHGTGLRRMLNPAETPLAANSPVRSIEIQYPKRLGFASGTNTWVIYWFVVSFAAALCCRRMLNVQL